MNPFKKWTNSDNTQSQDDNTKQYGYSHAENADEYSSEYQWGWKTDKGKYIPYDSEICREIDNLHIGDSYFIFANNTQYEVRKMAKHKCEQTNLQSNRSREVIRQFHAYNDDQDTMYNQQTQMTNDNHTKYQYNSHNNEDMKQESDLLWHWMDNDGHFKPMDQIVSEWIDDLFIGESMAHNTYYGQYEIKRISKTKCRQRNIKNNNTRDICKISPAQQQQYNSNPNNTNKLLHRRNNSNHHQVKQYNLDNNRKKKDITKWYYQSDGGEYKAISNHLSDKLNNLVIGASIKTKIANSMYEFKKTAIGKGQQRNIKTNKVRIIKKAKYGWFYEENDKSLKPFAQRISKQISACSIGKSFIFSLKSGAKYEITKTSANQGRQRNMSTNFIRKIVYKMTLNDDGRGNGSCGHFRGSSTATNRNKRPNLLELAKKAMNDTQQRLTAEISELQKQIKSKLY